MNKISRRSFFRRTAAAGAAGAIIMTKGAASASANPGQAMATVIDLTRCDGCANHKTPLCVVACQTKNQARFPEPVKPLMDYWPRKGFEDWSDKKGLRDRLTPYNWLYVQKVTINGKTVYAPRRCMHCDEPTCAYLCPFGVIAKHGDGSVIIDPDGCFGGAKCRDVCPWGIPMRQAGVGIYLKLAPKLGGGGVMYKCDMCHDLVQQGKNPSCVTACPQQAMAFGDRTAMKQLAESRSKEISGYVYGVSENGGTSTYYVSPVSFAEIDRALREQKVVDGKPGRAGMPVKVDNKVDQLDSWAAGVILAPVAAVFAAGRAAYKSLSDEKTSTDETDKGGDS